MSFDFASILFAGSCNQRCPTCIGRCIDPAYTRSNLDEFLPRNITAWVALLRQHKVQQVTFTGVNTDPQLYRHEARLIGWLRAKVPGVRIALHTNGQLAQRKMAVFNLYDRATVSFPSFDPVVFERMSGVAQMPDLAAIVRAAQIPVKVSCLLTEHNVGQIDRFLDNCRKIGVRRVALRQLYGDTRRWNILSDLAPVSWYQRNPVYNYQGMQVTWWNFAHTSSTSLNLFSDGSISTEYLLAKHKTVFTGSIAA